MTRTEEIAMRRRSIEWALLELKIANYGDNVNQIEAKELIYRLGDEIRRWVGWQLTHPETDCGTLCSRERRPEHYEARDREE